jgi:hypothetical protein
LESRAYLEITPDFRLNLTINITTILALQRALAYTVDHSSLTPDDPIRPLAEAFQKAIKDLEGAQTVLSGLLGVKMDLSRPPPPPPTATVEKKDG